jgi:hypothetical protein
VRFANEAVGAPALLLLPPRCGEERSLDGKGAVASDGVAGPCAVEGVAERGRRMRRMREGKGIMASRREKEGWRTAQWLSCSRCQVPAFVESTKWSTIATWTGPAMTLVTCSVREWPQGCTHSDPGSQSSNCRLHCIRSCLFRDGRKGSRAKLETVGAPKHIWILLTIACLLLGATYSIHGHRYILLLLYYTSR